MDEVHIGAMGAWGGRGAGSEEGGWWRVGLISPRPPERRWRGS